MSVVGYFPFAQTPLAASAIIAALVSLLYVVYRRALPKPLPGIPYNQGALGTLLGDASELRAIKMQGGRPRAWFGEQAVRHQSPLVQAFLAPFSKPSLILSDFREANDILLRRSKEFDRGGRNLAALGGVIKYHHIGMRTSDPQFKENRNLVKDLMTPQFLNTVRATHGYLKLSALFQAECILDILFQPEKGVYTVHVEM
jgi:hypothetical protein